MRSAIAVGLALTIAVLGWGPKAAADKPQTTAEVIETFRRAWGAQPGVMRPLEDQGWKARVMALCELVKLGPKALPALLTALDDKDAAVRALAAQALGFLGETSAAEKLEHLLAKDPDPTVRIYAADALGMIGGMKSKPRYEQAAKDDKDKDVRAHALWALARNGEELAPAVRKLFEEFNLDGIDTARRGEPAPDFTLTDVQGKVHRLSDLRGKQAAILTFIYGTGTYGLVRQYGAKRKDFEERGAKVFVIDPHDSWRVKHLLTKAGFDTAGLAVPVLCDPTHVVGATYGVAFQMKQFTEWSNRPATFLIDKGGVIRYAHRGKNYGDRPRPEEVLQELDKLTLGARQPSPKKPELTFPSPSPPPKGWTPPPAKGQPPPREAPPDPKAGQHVEWEGWTFNWSLRVREGLVLHEVYFRGRKVLKYAGLAEIVVAYDEGVKSVDFGDPRPDFGPLPLLPGVDCGSGSWCKAFDAKGNEAAPGTLAVVMMHEENAGPNYVGNFGRVPAKVLVLWSTLNYFYNGRPDGYIYLIRWKFRDDGTLMPEIGATGAVRRLRIGDSSAVGALVGKDLKDNKVFAPSHCHNYLFRLDFDIDGSENNVVEEFNWQKEAGSTKAQKASCSWTPLVKETGRPCNPEIFRSWRVVNRNSKNALDHPRSYHLIPGNTGVYRTDKEPASQADLWVTLYKPSEFPYSPVDPRSSLEALPKYVDGESVEGKDVVVWYWLGFHHYPRTEDFMHQPVVWKGFELMPRDFLDTGPVRPGK